MVSQKIVYNNQQLTVFEQIKLGASNLVIKARAGSGKTFTIEHALQFLPTNVTYSFKVLFLAFNKSIKEEFESRFKKVWHNFKLDIKTLHGLGWSILRWNLKTIELDNNKAKNYIGVMAKNWVISVMDEASGKEMQVDPNNEHWDSLTRNYRYNVKKLVDMARLSLASTKEEIAEVAVKHGIDIFNGEIDHCIEVLEQMNKQHLDNVNCVVEAYQDKKVFDFVDMVYYPIMAQDSIRVWGYDRVFVDEAQDLNAAQRALVQRVIKHRIGRFIAVGDDRQAIYGFAGADAESFEKLQQMPNTKTLPLTVCYRCDINIIKEAQKIVEDIQWKPGALEGIVRVGKPEEVRVGDYVLCRNTLPLVEMCLKFLAKGIKANIMGRDIGKHLIQVVESTRTKSLKTMWMRFEGMLQKITNRLIRKGVCPNEIQDEQEYINFNQKLEIIRVFEEMRNCNTPSQICNTIKTIFSDDKDGIVLSTIHRAKGLENGRVFILHPELMPSKYASKPWQIQQERNLEYVAVTRAKNELVYLPKPEKKK